MPAARRQLAAGCRWQASSAEYALVLVKPDRDLQKLKALGASSIVVLPIESDGVIASRDHGDTRGIQSTMLAAGPTGNFMRPAVPPPAVSKNSGTRSDNAKPTAVCGCAAYW